ncbi:MAG: hypothetical protein JSV90_08970 [Methanobacteriota archaeon]|nr:MAG: hypothetical protein JSV90_08970 [Euryarchaeota archaeon]
MASNGDWLSGGRIGRFNIIALIGAVIAAIGLIVVVAAYSMQKDAMNDYLRGLPYIQYLDRIESANEAWTIGVVFIAISVIVIAFSIHVNSADALERTKKRIQLELSDNRPSSEERHGRRMKPGSRDEPEQHEHGGITKRI